MRVNSLRYILRTILYPLFVSALTIQLIACSDDKPTNSGNEPDPDASNPAIAYVSSADGNREIYITDSDGTHKTRLTNNDSPDYRPVWSPEGTRIAFVSGRAGGQTDIYVMRVNGSAQVRLTNDLADDDYPVWSRDGARMLFETNRDGNNEIYVIDLTTLTKTNLTNNTAYDGQACWAHDDLKIAFISDRTGKPEVYVMNSDGSDQTRLTPDGGGTRSHPDWSPDGSKILYTDRVALDESLIRWVDPAGIETHVVTPQVYNWVESNARWSPSEDKIVFDAWYTFQENYPPHEWVIVCFVSICNADGSETTSYGFLSRRVARFPRWSADGSRIYCADNDRICVYSADGNEIAVLAEGLATDPMPHWRPQ